MKNTEKQFYIGWQENMPKAQKKSVKAFVIGIFIALPILAFLIIYAQRGFNDHIFELGKSTELTGIYHSRPVPILEIEPHKESKIISPHILLVGFGKFGAEGIIKTMEEEHGNLNGRKITIKGTLIQGDGKTVLELTKKARSLLEVHNQKALPIAPKESLRAITLEGEILDPKCYFGVMKPGEGKIHKSCAIRCISGGIPPVLRSISTQQQKEFYVLLGEKGEKINKEILDKIAENIRVSGKSAKLNGWNYLYINPADIRMMNN